MQHFRIHTKRGSVYFSAAGEIGPNSVVAFHGAFGSPHVFGGLSEIVPNLILAYLPDHGPPSLNEASVWAYIDAFSEALPKFLPPVPVVGDSLGGLVALGMPARLIVAIDPPLTTAKQWHLREMLQTDPQQRKDLAKAYFGFPDKNIDYWPIIENININTHIITGNIRSGRKVFPTMIDDSDLERLTTIPMVTTHIVDGGHRILTEQSKSVCSIIDSLLYANK